MSDNSISIVCRESSYLNNKEKAQEILAWLVANDIVDPTPSDCTYASENGYTVSKGAKSVVKEPDYLHFGSGMINGLSIVTERSIFDTGGNGIDELTCPSCKRDILQESWDLDPWLSGETDNLVCPLCEQPNEIHNYIFRPEWGFGNLGFTFWNWPEFTAEFIIEFKQRLGCDVNIVYCHL